MHSKSHDYPASGSPALHAAPTHVVVDHIKPGNGVVLTPGGLLRAQVHNPWVCTALPALNSTAWRLRRLFFVIGLLVASVFPPISFLLCWSKVPAVRTFTVPFLRSRMIMSSVAGVQLYTGEVQLFDNELRNACASACRALP